MSAHISIAFYGKFKPLHIEADDISHCLNIARKKLPKALLDDLSSIVRGFNRQRKARISVVRTCHEDYRRAISLALGKRDPWLDEITSTLPAHPEIQY